MGKANSTARSLIEISKTQGWDATRIWDQEKGAYGESMVAWDHAREPFDRGLGELPQDAPAHDQSNDVSGGPAMTESITFEYPDLSREAKVSGNPKMSLSPPDPGKVGA